MFFQAFSFDQIYLRSLRIKKMKICKEDLNNMFKTDFKSCVESIILNNLEIDSSTFKSFKQKKNNLYVKKDNKKLVARIKSCQTISGLAKMLLKIGIEKGCESIYNYKNY